MSTDTYELLDPVGQRMFLLDDAWTNPSDLDPRLYLSDPQGHALLVGTNGRALTVLDMGGLVDVASVHVTSPEGLEQMAERLRMLADRLRRRASESTPERT